VLEYVGVELEAIPGLRKNISQEGKRGGDAGGRGWGGHLLKAGGVGPSDGSSQSLVAWGDGFNLHQRIERGGRERSGVP